MAAVLTPSAAIETAVARAQTGVVVASGYGVKITVYHKHLVVNDGVGRDRRTRRYHRATGGLKRVVVISHTGYVTFDALRWIRDVGAALIQLDRDGQPVAMTAPVATNLPGLRRAQALGASSPTGLDIARLVLGEKLRGQAAVLRELPATTRSTEQVDQTIRQLDAATDLPGLLAAEFAAASAYWNAWSTVALSFPRSQAARLPEHWLTFGQRYSALTRTSRVATNPANAMLNYLYALLESETTIACQTIGLDPGIGVFHTGKPGRSSLALDLMEACRPVIDAYLLAWFTQRTLSPGDFVETTRGACRLHPSMSEQLAETTLVWASHVAPIVEQVAQRLADESGTQVATSLTQTNRKAAWSARHPTQIKPRSEVPPIPQRCRDCGNALTDRRRYCDPCRRERFNQQARPAGRMKAAEVLATLRLEQRDPAHGGEPARKRGRKNAEHQRAVAAWNESNGTGRDPRAFEQAVLPALRVVPIADLTAATGLSAHYCSLVRLGKRVPHPRHWDALEKAGAASAAA